MSHPFGFDVWTSWDLIIRDASHTTERLYPDGSNTSKPDANALLSHTRVNAMRLCKCIITASASNLQCNLRDRQQKFPCQLIQPIKENAVHVNTTGICCASMSGIGRRTAAHIVATRQQSMRGAARQPPMRRENPPKRSNQTPKISIKRRITL